MNHLLWLLVLVIIPGTACFSQPIGERDVPFDFVHFWMPPGTLVSHNDSSSYTQEEYVKYGGRTKSDYKRETERMQKLISLLLTKLKREYSDHHTESVYQTRSEKPIETSALDDILLNGDQINRMILNASPRRKRKIYTFDSHPYAKWPMPIKYKVDPTFSASVATLLDDSMTEWMNKTCIVFEKVPFKKDLTGIQHLLLTDGFGGCRSYLGRNKPSYVFPQPIYISKGGCTTLRGIPLHEIGHALGLYHEHVRRDRDNFVKINLKSIDNNKLAQFAKQSPSDYNTLDVAYDVGSIMHYGAKDFSNDGRPTIQPIDESLMKVLGQRSEISFYDAQIINTAYCPNKCATKLSCQNHGYTDPLDCGKCRCPDGYGGKLCDKLDSGSSSCRPMSNVIEVDTSATNDFECIESGNYSYISNTGYTRYGSFNEGDHCNWKLKVPSGCTVDMWFNQPWFGLFESTRGACMHWLEIYHKPSHTVHGQRFCGYKAPSYTQTNPLRSSTNEVLVIFKSPPLGNFQKPWHYYRGFRLCYRISNPSCRLATTQTSTTVYSKTTRHVIPISTQTGQAPTFHTTPTPLSTTRSTHTPLTTISGVKPTTPLPPLCRKLFHVLCRRLTGIVRRNKQDIRVFVVKYTIRQRRTLEAVQSSLTKPGGVKSVTEELKCMVEELICSYRNNEFAVTDAKLYISKRQLVLYFMLNIGSGDGGQQNAQGDANSTEAILSNNDHDNIGNTDFILDALNSDDDETEIIFSEVVDSIQMVIPKHLLEDENKREMRENEGTMSYKTLCMILAILGVLLAAIVIAVLVCLYRKCICWSATNEETNHNTMSEDISRQSAIKNSNLAQTVSNSYNGGSDPISQAPIYKMGPDQSTTQPEIVTHI